MNNSESEKNRGQGDKDDAVGKRLNALTQRERAAFDREFQEGESAYRFIRDIFFRVEDGLLSAEEADRWLTELEKVQE
jgi:hypothetical protein